MSKNLANIMKQAQKMQEKMGKVQDELGLKECRGLKRRRNGHR